MDDVSMMDTTSDDELDFNTPLWKRISRRQDSSYGLTGISGSAKDGQGLLLGKPYFEKTHDAFKTSESSSTADAIAFGERGSPLSEVTSNISRSPPFTGKLNLSKSSPFARFVDCKVKASANSVGTCDSKADTRPHEKQEGTRYPVSSKEGLSKTEPTLGNIAPGVIKHLDQKDNIEPPSRSSSIYSGERAEASEKQLYSELSSTLSGSHVKGGWKKLNLSPAESPRKLLSSPPFPGRYSGQISPKRNSIGSSVHIHWDRNKQMQSTSLESRTNSPGKHRANFGTNSRNSSSPLFGIRSPVLIPDTPELSRRHDAINGRDSGSKKHRQSHYRKSHGNNLLLNDLLSEGEHDSSKDMSSSPSSSKYLSSFSPSPGRKNTSSDRSFLSPSKKFKDYGLRKQEGSSEKKVFTSRDPVWDFADETLSSPEKHSPHFSTKFDFRRRQRDGAFSRDSTCLNKIVSPDKDSRSRQQCTSTTSEDDDLPLISLVTHKQKSNTHMSPKSPDDSIKLKPDASVISPSRTWASPPKKRSWGSPSHSVKPATVVISPWRPQTSGSCGLSSRLDNSNKDRLNQESTSKNILRSGSEGDVEDKIARRKRAMAEMKKKKMMKSLLAVFSSDEDEDVHSCGEKKRKMEDDVVSVTQTDEAAKRRKLNQHNSSSDRPGSGGSREHESSFRTRHKDTSSIRRRVKNSLGMPVDTIESSSFSDHVKTRGHNVSSTITHISSRKKGVYHSSSASCISSSTASSPSYPNYGSTSTAATSSKASSSPSNKTLSSHAFSNEAVHTRNSKGKGKKRGKSPTDSSSRKEVRRKSSRKDRSPDASSGISVDPVNVVKDDSGDEVVMLGTYSYASSLVGSYGKNRKSHKNTETKASSTGPSSSGSTGSLHDERDTVSPSILQQLNQMDADEAMARRLQEEFDAEMARSVQQHGPSNRSTEDTNHQADSMASCSVNVQGTDQPDAGTFGNFNPHHNISIEVSSDVPVQIGSFNWNYDFQPASSLLGQPGRPLSPPSPPPMHRRGRLNPRQRGSRRRNCDDRLDEDIPDLANPPRGGRPHNQHRPDMEMIWNLHHDLFPGRDIRWMPYPDLEHINPPPRPGRQQGRGRGRARGRRRNANVDQNDGNDYDALLQLADNLGPAVDKRLTQSSIDRLPTFKFSKEQHSGSDEENSCPICMDDYEEGAELRRLPCFHGYHKKCIDMWLKKNQDPVCPICRVEVRIE